MMYVITFLLVSLQFAEGQNGAIDDKFVFRNASVKHVRYDDNGLEYMSPVTLQRLDVLSNDQLPFDDVSSCWKKPMNSNQTHGIKFTEIAEIAGITHRHRLSIPNRPHCSFDFIVPTYNSSRHLKLPGQFCTIDYISGGAASGDYNNDGFIDLFFAVYHGRSVLYRNNGDGTYTNVTDETGVGPDMYANGAGFFDIDQDGDLDLYVTSFGGTRHYLYVNYGGYFKEEAIERNVALESPTKRKLAAMTPNFGDYDNDGYLDIYTTEWILHNNGKPSVSRLLRNLGATKPGYFEDTTDFAGVNMDSYWDRGTNLSAGTHTFGSSFSDLDMDGWPDLLITADFQQSRVFWNNKNGTFRACNTECGLIVDADSMGHAIGDWNNDGNLDWFSSAVYEKLNQCSILGCLFHGIGSKLFINNGNRTFTNVTHRAGVKDGGWAWGAAFIDFNNDGYLDLVHTNGFDSTGTTLDDQFTIANMRLFENTKNATQPGNVYKMNEVAKDYKMVYTGQGRGLLKADIDNDGDEDVIVAANYGPAQIFRNDGGNKANWIKVIVMNKCLGDETKLCESYGALVTVTTPDGRKQLQEIGSSSHFLGQSERTAHFGLGEFSSNINVRITWPSKQISVHVQNVLSKNVLRIVRPAGSIQMTFSELQQCPMWELDAITKQPDGLVAEINPDKTTISLDVSDDTHLYNIGIKDFEYSVKLVPTQSQVLSYKKQAVVNMDLNPEPYTDICAGMPPRNMTPTDERRFDGLSNNKQHLTWGSTGTELKRVVHSDYSDGISMPAGGCGRTRVKAGKCPFANHLGGFGSERPSPREISNVLFSQTKDIQSKRKVNDLNMHFGQFLSHDMDLTSEMPRFQFQAILNEVWLPIPVPKGDVQFDPYRKGDGYLPFLRSLYNRCTGYYPNGNSRQQINMITAYLDSSMVYGSSAKRNQHLRTFKDGKMIQGADGILPKNVNGIPNGNMVGREPTHLYISGDTRTNVQPGLIAMHSLFVREHNRLCNEYRQRNPNADDETIFQHARRIVIAEIQSITFNEYLPSLLGGKQHIPAYGQYKSNVDPTISNIFGTAAFRYGHSQVNSHLFRLDENYKQSHYGHALLRESYFAPEKIADEGGLDPLIRGMMYFPSQEIDSMIVDELRNVLFPNGPTGGLDLAALNIQRGRDHGLPDYNSVRKILGLQEKTSFSDITSNVENAEKLKQLYNTVDNIDLWVGGLSEDHETGSEMGETFRVILLETFLRVRDGDRFWYENIMTQEEINHIESLTLTKIIEMNTGVKNLPSYSFFAMNSCDDVVDFQCVQKTTDKTIDELIIENRELKMSNERTLANYHKATQDYMYADDDKDEMRSLSIGLGVVAAFLLVLCILLILICCIQITKNKKEKNGEITAYAMRQSPTSIEKTSLGSSNKGFAYP